MRTRRRLSSVWRAELGVRFEKITADSTAAVHTTDDARSVHAGDTLEFAELPGAVAADVGQRKRTVLRA